MTSRLKQDVIQDASVEGKRTHTSTTQTSTHSHCTALYECYTTFCTAQNIDI